MMIESLKLDKEDVPNSYDIVGAAVNEYFIHNSYEPVIAFFYQKYKWESDDRWEWHEEFVDVDINSGTVIFLYDFCEGQTCVKDLTIVPLSSVTEYYAENVLKGGTQ